MIIQKSFSDLDLIAYENNYIYPSLSTLGELDVEFFDLITTTKKRFLAVIFNWNLN